MPWCKPCRAAICRTGGRRELRVSLVGVHAMTPVGPWHENQADGGQEAANAASAGDVVGGTDREHQWPTDDMSRITVSPPGANFCGFSFRCAGQACTP